MRTKIIISLCNVTSFEIITYFQMMSAIKLESSSSDELWVWEVILDVWSFGEARGHAKSYGESYSKFLCWIESRNLLRTNVNDIRRKIWKWQWAAALVEEQITVRDERSREARRLNFGKIPSKTYDMSWFLYMRYKRLYS